MPTVDELTEYAEETLEIDVPSKATKAEIQALIDGAENNDKKSAAEKSAEVVTGAKKGVKRVKIMIPSRDDDARPVFVGVNGRSYLIKRDVPVDVPEFVVGVLETAKETRWNKAEQAYKEVLSYPFTRL